MESIEDEIKLTVDFDEFINDTFDEIITGSKREIPIQDVGAGYDAEYERQLVEQKKKRQQYLQYKEKRRRESKEDRLMTALMEKRELEEQLKSDRIHKQTDDNRNQSSQRQRFKPLERIDRNVRFNRNTSNEELNKRQTFNTVIDEFSINKKLKTDPDSQNVKFGFTTVLIRNLSSETNEFTINSLGEAMGKVLGVCIVLEKGVRKALARFESPVDALVFQRNYDNYKLGSNFITTTLIP